MADLLPYLSHEAANGSQAAHGTVNKFKKGIGGALGHDEAANLERPGH